MDRELRGTTLAQSFERLKSDKGLHAETRGRSGKTDEAQVASDDNDDYLSDGSDDDSDAVGDVDIETNLVKYFLESHASQLGLPGPASLLLSQLGVSMPTAPPQYDQDKRDQRADR
jgi:hypothetical protein